MNIKDVPLGVVKKFKFDYQPYGQQAATHVEVVGAVIKNMIQRQYQLIDTSGHVYSGSEMANIEYSISRSDPEAAKLLRDAVATFNTYSDCYQQLEELQKQKYVLQDAYRNSLRALENYDTTKKSGVSLSDVEAAAKEFIVKLNNKPKCFGRSVEDEAYELNSVAYNANVKGVTVKFGMLLHIEKYASPDRYPFIYREYDNNYFISDDDTLKTFLARYTPNYMTRLSQGFAKAPFESSLGKVQADLADKNWLLVSQILTINLITPAGYQGFVNFVKNFN